MSEAYSYRTDPSVPEFPDDKPIIIFDGACVICSRGAQFVVRHDRKKVFRLLAAQTRLGAALYRHYGLDPVDYQTNLLIENGRHYVKSEGTIMMAERLGFPWSLMALLRLLPFAMRERLYDHVASSRFRWFGRRESCYLMEAGEEDRFLA